MRRKKQNYKKIFFAAIGLFLLLVIFLVWISLKSPTQNDSFYEQQTESQEETETESKDFWEERETDSESKVMKEVNEKNDKEHIAGAELFPIEGAETYIEPVMDLWLYKIHEKVETYVERYAPGSTKAVCLNSAPSRDSSTSVLFFMELDDRKETLIEAEYDTTSRDVIVRECTRYTKEEILKEVWITEGVPTVRDVQ